MNWVRHAGRVAILLSLSILSSSGAPPATAEAALELLGRRLLAERRLSADGSTSCLSCHQPERGYGDGNAVAYPGGLNTPPLWGLAERQSFGWFSPELTTLEAAALRPLANPNEMDRSAPRPWRSYGPIRQPLPPTVGPFPVHQSSSPGSRPVRPWLRHYGPSLYHPVPASHSMRRLSGDKPSSLNWAV